MEKIIFRNHEYLGKYLGFDFGERLISIISLENALISDSNYVDEQARVIDEQIFYYVEDSEIEDDDETLIQRINSRIL